MPNPDSYYSHSGVSNPDLTEPKNYLYSCVQYGDKERALKFGTLVDALTAENDRIRCDELMVDDYLYTTEEFKPGPEMCKAFQEETKENQFLAVVLAQSGIQKFVADKQQELYYGNFAYHPDTRCEWGRRLPAYNFGGDLKMTFAELQMQFGEAIDFFDWDRSRAWYMDITGNNRDFVYAILKKNYKIFKYFITDCNHPTYIKGKEEYEGLTFEWWQLVVQIYSKRKQYESTNHFKRISLG